MYLVAWLYKGMFLVAKDILKQIRNMNDDNDLLLIYSHNPSI